MDKLKNKTLIYLSDNCYLDIERGKYFQNGLEITFSKNETLLLQCLAQSIGHPVSKKN
ncbi:hypothetical protein AAC03nite_17130 [Alicyclobacillus acidoterrestris]|nr:hypothetical protein AAC03nite_17130 [Alicyclobacillus acidoterrestris]